MGATIEPETRRPKVLVISADATAKGCANRSMTDAMRALHAEYDFQLLTLAGDRSVYPLPRQIEVIAPGREDRETTVAGKLIRMLVGLPRLIGIVERSRPDIVMSFLPRPNVTNVMLKLASRWKYKCVVCEHNFTSVQFSEGVWRRSLRAAIKIAYRRADLVVVVARDLARDVENSYRVPRARIRVVHPSIDLAAVRRLAREDPEGAPDLFASPAPVVLTVGRLIPQKNHSLLIRAFARARARLPCQLAILGEGPLGAQLRELVQRLGVTEDVFFLGWKDNPFSFMRRAAVMVLSSNHEGFPLVLAEAMACGCPIVSTDCPSGPAEMLEDGRFGVLVPMRDDVAMAAAIVRLLSDAGLRADLAGRAQVRCRSFDIPQIANAYRAALNSV